MQSCRWETEPVPRFPWQCTCPRCVSAAWSQCTSVRRSWRFYCMSFGMGQTCNMRIHVGLHCYCSCVWFCCSLCGTAMRKSAPFQVRRFTFPHIIIIMLLLPAKWFLKGVRIFLMVCNGHTMFLTVPFSLIISNHLHWKLSWVLVEFNHNQ